jgi:hypothetical protein
MNPQIAQISQIDPGQSERPLPGLRKHNKSPLPGERRIARQRSHLRNLRNLWILLPVLPVLPAPSVLFAQSANVVVVMLDGTRWQEVFGGADSMLISRKPGGVSDTAGLRAAFWRPSENARRRALMPFLWDSVVPQGQIFGNVRKRSVDHTVNRYWFSYPGYSETLTGVFDTTVNSNDFPPNPNPTVFEWLNGFPEFHDSVVAFGSWEAFDRIFNERRAGFPVFAAWQSPWDTTDADPAHATVARLYGSMLRYWGEEVWDGLMQQAVLQYVRARQPRLLFVGFGEPDEWAHAGRYDFVLQSLHNADGFIAELWSLLQSLPQYRGHTTLIITTDHGRGSGPDGWKDHWSDVKGSGYIWLAAMGAGVPPKGERADAPEIRQAQVAATVARLLGKDFRSFRKDAWPALDWRR